jgi:uncharacterized protein
MMDENWIEGFKEKLDQHYTWPALYTFKFIVAKEKAQEVINLFPLNETRQKSSSKGKYTSVTVEMMMPSSESIMQVYLEASRIEGIIAL